jgi:hypothetical protein
MTTEAILVFLFAHRRAIGIGLALLGLAACLALAVFLPTWHTRAFPAVTLLAGSFVAGFVAAKEGP